MGDGSPRPRKASGHGLSLNDGGEDPSRMLAALGLEMDGSVGDDGDPSLTASKIRTQQARNGSRMGSFKLEKSPDINSAGGFDRYVNAAIGPSSKRPQANKPSEMDGTSEPLSSLAATSHKVNSTPPSYAGQSPNSSPDLDEFERLKRQLAEAHDKMARMDLELHQTRITNHTLDQTVGQGTDNELGYKGDVTDQTISSLQHTFNAATRGPKVNRQGSWPPTEDARSDSSDPTSNVPFNRNQANWQSVNKTNFAANGAYTIETMMPPMGSAQQWNGNMNRPWFAAGNGGPPMSASGYLPPMTAPLQQRGGPSLRLDTFRNNQMLNEPAHFSVDGGLRRGLSNPPSRPNSAFDARVGGWGYASTMNTTDGAGVSPPLTPLSAQSMHMYPMPNQVYPPRAIGTRLSPTAAEFSYEGMAPTPWNNQIVSQPYRGRPHINQMQDQAEQSGTYVASTEPMNYRRLLDRTMNCNWKYIVDKIVCGNDQQASIFLQQKLKVGTTEQKHDIVDAIIAQAFHLMINRFGNFLVQRCFEHGTPDQIVQIAQAIRGNTLQLSMDPFGCHVIQKAFDAVPEEYKAVMVHELLRCIPETVIHRYACHVWQKLFELRWSDSPPQIMKYVNEALRGMWHEVALGETGSLVVQNIFENCLEEDKRPCINEVLASIDVIAHGQFGNWCIQHICEHGAPADRSRAIDHILRFATEYSMDQYASKVIEKCLKIGGTDFLDRYLERVCEARPDRPRMPLIDIAGDQFGNYLVQYILTHTSPQHRDVVSNHVRKHMVSLRGSKYGSRVAMLCCNPAFATRPGPPAGMQVNRYNGPQHATRGGYGNPYR